MDRKIIPLQRESASRVLLSEWAHQISALEQSIHFFEEYFLWSSDQIKQPQASPAKSPSATHGDFYVTEAPMVVEEAKDALHILKLMLLKET